MRQRTCLAMGVFDGVHIGHQAIILQAVRMARPNRGSPAVLTFDPHPDAVISPKGAPPLLTTTEEKLELIRKLGIRLAVVARFDRKLAAMPAEEFVRRIIVEKLRAGCVIVGKGWRFGAGGEGTTRLLRQMAPKIGFEVSVIPSVIWGGATVSSTRIRTLVAAGDLAAAHNCLGRYYALSGRVVAGKGLGHGLGFPTANLEVSPGKLVPPYGVYAGWAGRWKMGPAVISIGVRPTFEKSGKPRVETHLLGPYRGGELLGRVLRLWFARRLRAERRFASREALVRQIAHDCEQAIGVLALHAPPDMLSCQTGKRAQ